MARTCTICGHANREAINASLVAGEAFRNIAERFGTSPTALFRHKKEHLPATLMKAEHVRDIVEAGTLLDRLKSLNHETAAILREVRADATKDNELALKAIARVEKQLELEGKLLGELITDGSTVNVVLMPEWTAIRLAILAALEAHPAARIAVAGALKNVGA